MSKEKTTAAETPEPPAAAETPEPPSLAAQVRASNELEGRFTAIEEEQARHSAGLQRATQQAADALALARTVDPTRWVPELVRLLEMLPGLPEPVAVQRDVLIARMKVR